MRWAPTTLPYEDPTRKKMPEMEVGGPQPGPRFVEDTLPPVNTDKMTATRMATPAIPGDRFGGGRYASPTRWSGFGWPRGGWGGGWGGPRGSWGMPRMPFGPMRGSGYPTNRGSVAGETGGNMYTPPPFGIVGDGPNGTIAENYKPTQFSQSLEELFKQRQAEQQMQTNEMGLPPNTNTYGGGYGGPSGNLGGGRYGGPTYQFPAPQYTKPAVQPPVFTTGQGLVNSNVKPATPPPLYPTGGWKPPKPQPVPAQETAMTKPQAPPYMAPPMTVTANTDRNNTDRKKPMLAPEQPGMPYSKPETM